MKVRSGFVSNSSSSSFLVIGDTMEKEEFDAMRDKILEFLKEHPKLDIFYTDDMERDWPLELEPDFGEFEYNRIFRWSDSIIVGIEYNGGGLAEMKRIAAELEGLFGVSSDDLGIFYWSFYDG